jgi:tRNA1(Val) A37 N6-methylase TrmN6
LPGVSVTGAEIDSELVGISNRNATANELAGRVVFVTVDVLDLPADMKRDYDHVFCNPPFHGSEGMRSPDDARAAAMQDDGMLAEWLSVGVRRTVSGGTFTAIVRTDRLGEALAALPALGISVFPLWPRAGEPASRILLQIRKGSRSAARLLAGLVLHEPDGAYTNEADAVLRGERGLNF